MFDERLHLPGSSWPSVLSEALHCIRSLISTATDALPHDLFLRFERNFWPLPSTVTLHTGVVSPDFVDMRATKVIHLET